MSEVELLYKNAGVEPTHYDACALEDKYWNNEELANQYGTLDSYLSFECPYYGEGCYSTCEYAYDKDEYPPFTAEKQLELIKWLMVNNKDYQYDIEDNKYWFFIDDYRETKYREFNEALAELITLYWQDLTEQERKQIAEILRG